MQLKTEAGKAHEIKNPAIAFGIYGQGAKRLGDIALTSKGLVWNNGKKASKDVTVKWDAFITWMQSQLQPGAKVAAKAGKSTKSGKPAAKSAKAGKSGKTGAAIRAARASKVASAKKGATKINGRSAGTSKVAAGAVSRQKPATKIAH